MKKDKISIIFIVAFLGLFVQNPENVIDKKAFKTSVSSINICSGIDQFDICQDLIFDEVEEDSQDHSKYFAREIINKIQKKHLVDAKNIKERPYLYITCRLHTPWLYKIPPPIS